MSDESKRVELPSQSNNQPNPPVDVQEEPKTSFMGTLIRMVVIYQIFSMTQRYFLPYLFNQTSPNQVNLANEELSDNLDLDLDNTMITKDPNYLYPLWTDSHPFDVEIYISKYEILDIYNNPDYRISFHDFSYGNTSDDRFKEISVPVDQHLLSNGSLYAHVRVLSGHSYPPLTSTASLIRYFPRFNIKEKKSLLKKDKDTSLSSITEKTNDDSPIPIIQYWWSNLTFNLVHDTSPLPRRLNPQVLNHVNLYSKTQYNPILWNNDFWLMKENLIPINDTLKSLNLTIQFSQIQMWKFQIYIQFQESLRVQSDVFGVPSSESDELKRMFLETNPYLLGITFSVSLLHSLFDFLAFKNDIQFWRNKDSMEGLSFRSVVLSFIFQFIIFLYLFDNETSWMIIISTGIGLLIELWKIFKIVKFDIDFKTYRVSIVSKIKPSKDSLVSQKHDQVAFKYLSFLLFPLFFVYTIYSIYYEQHKGWYSFVIGTLVGFVYMFGFIAMTPQLYINYKLKSVAHMPWKTFMYKALNTFIDDLFAFVIKMPTLHRLACLRDDVIFFVYLYQRWVYVEDKNRANEFGQKAKEIDVDVEKKDQ